MIKLSKGISVVIPCYNEVPRVVHKLVNELYVLGFEVIVVNDGGKYDYTNSNAVVINHNGNFGYGKALKTGVRAASHEVIITSDGDGQHIASEIDRLGKIYKLMDCDMLIGQRRLKYERFIRTAGRKGLNFVASLFTNRYMLDLNSGLRVFRRDLALNYEPILCDRYSYTTSITLAFMTDNYSVEWTPIKIYPRRYGSSKVRLAKDGLVTLWQIIKIGTALRSRRIREWLRKMTKS